MYRLLLCLALGTSACAMTPNLLSERELVAATPDRAVPCPPGAQRATEALRDGTIRAQWCEGKTGRHGPFLEWHANGKVKTAGIFDHGERSGLWRSFYWNGSPEQSVSYVNGYVEGKFTQWFSNGVVASEAHYRHGELHGPYVTRFKTGAKKFEGRYDLGVENGKFVTYAADGTPRETIEYRSGEPIASR